MSAASQLLVKTSSDFITDAAFTAARKVLGCQRTSGTCSNLGFHSGVNLGSPLVIWHNKAFYQTKGNFKFATKAFVKNTPKTFTIPVASLQSKFLGSGICCAEFKSQWLRP